MDWKTNIRTVARWIAVSSGIVLLLLGVAFGLAQTGAGKRQIAKLLAKGLSQGDEIRAEVGEITGAIPIAFRLDRMILRDREGQWLTIEGILVRWSPWALLQGHIDIDEVVAGHIYLDRLPAGGKDGQEGRKGLPTWPRALHMLHVNHLAIKRLGVGPALLGENATFEIEGKFMAEGTGEVRLSSLRLERTDGPKAGAVITAEVKGKTDEITVDAQVEEASGGLFARALGFKGPLVCSLHGEGPVQAWKGTLGAEVGGLGQLKGFLEVDARKDRKLSAEGTLAAAQELLPAALVPTLGGENSFTMEVQLSQTDEVVLNHLRLETMDGVHVQLAGSLDLKDEITRGKFTVTCDHIGSVGALADSGYGGSVVVQGRVSGPLRQPQATLSMKTQNVEIAHIQVLGVDASLGVRLLGPVGSPLFGLRVTGTGSVDGLTVRNVGFPAGTRFGWTLKAEGSLEKTIHIDELRFTGEEFSLGLAGLIYPAALKGVVETALEIPDLRWLSGLLGFELPASAVLEAGIDMDGQALSLSSQVRGKVILLDQASPSLKAFLGSGASYTGTVMLTEAKRLTISEFALETPTARLDGEASLDLEDDSLQGSCRLAMPRLAVLSPLLERSIGGRLEVVGEMHGPIRTVTLNAQATGQDILFEGWGVQGMSAKLHTDGLPPESRGQCELELMQGNQNVRAAADFHAAQSGVTFSNLLLEAGQNALSGRLALDLENDLVQGVVKGKCERLSDLSPFLREEIAGRAEFKSQFAIADTGQKIDFSFTGRDLKSRFGEAGTLFLHGELAEAFTAPRGTTQLELNSYRLDDLDLVSLALRVEGSVEQMKFEGRATGRHIENFDVDASGRIAMAPNGDDLHISRFHGHYSDWPFTLAGPVSILRTAKGYAMDGLPLDFGGGHLEGSWRIEDEQMTVDADFKGLPLGALRLVGAPDLAGTASGIMGFHGQGDESEGSIDIRLDEVALRDPQFQDFPSATLVARGELYQGRLNTTLRVQGFEEPIEAGLDIPLLVSVSPFTWSLPPNRELRGTLVGDMDLGWVPLLLSLDDQSMEGRLKVNLALGGIVKSPEITGGGRIEKGSYENVRIGTVLGEIDATITAKTRRLVIEKARASDSEVGLVTAQGWIDLLPSEDFPFNIDAELDRATLVRLDNATATGSGQVRLSGSFGKALLGGQLQVNQAELRIPNQVSADITELGVIEIHGVGEGTQDKPEESSFEGADLLLDIRAASTGRIYLRGRGLDSEWKGDIRASGKASAPALAGKFSVVRGHFNFLGKRFALTRGSLVLDGSIPPSPYLDVVGEASGKDMIAQLKLFGPAMAPEISLGSEPEFPSDEILSRLLFGRSVGDITPVQAVRLAYAARQLTSGGGGFDVMGSTRKLLGVDQLEIKQSGEGGGEPAVSAGKYLGEGVYLEIEKGVGRETGKTSVEVEVTPNITLDTEIGENAQGGVGLNWKLNY